jgi:zinc transport system ATP-binding protein
MTNSPIVEIQNLTFSYECHNVLENINLNINQSDVVAITGPNGAGKSTLIKLMMGVLKPAQGTIRILGAEPNQRKTKKRVGYVPQHATSFNKGFPTTVLEAVVAGRIASRGLFRPLTDKDYKQAEKSLDMVGLHAERHKRLSSLSGGQQQRVFIARAIVSQPELLILDEPTVGIDSHAHQVICELLNNLNQQHDLTLIIVTHEPDLIAKIINRQVCLDKKICHCSCHTGDRESIGKLGCQKSLWAYQSL